MKSIHPKRKMLLIFSVALFAFISSCGDSNENKENATAEDIPATVEMNAILTSPPNVPPPTGKRKAKKLIVDMEILEKEGEMTDGVKYVYWTFGGTVPGSFIRTKIGDEVEFHLKNHPDNRLPHNIDLMRSTVPGVVPNPLSWPLAMKRYFPLKSLTRGSIYIIVPRLR